MDREGTQPGPTPPSELSTRELLSEITGRTQLLVRDEIELAKSEVRRNVASEIKSGKWLGVAAVSALCTVVLLLVAIALGLATVMPAWGAALVVAGVVLAICIVTGLVGWAKRVKKPLQETRKTMKENVEWAKERMH